MTTVSQTVNLVSATEHQQ